MEQEEIIQRITLVLESFRLSQHALAQKSGINPTNLYKMLKGEQKITDKTLKNIAQATSVRFQWLLTGEGEMKEQNQSVCMSHNQLGDDNYNVEGNDNQVNSSDIIKRAFDEIAEHRKLIERSQDLLAEAIKNAKEQSDRFLSILERSLEK